MTVKTYPPHTRGHLDERSLGELVSDLSQKASTLARLEVQLAKAEVSQKVSTASKEIAILVMAGLIGNAALLGLMATLMLSLAEFMDGWLAALLVTILFAAIAGFLAWQGISALKKMNMMPQQTVATLKEDKEWLSRQLN